MCCEKYNKAKCQNPKAVTKIYQKVPKLSIGAATAKHFSVLESQEVIVGVNGLLKWSTGDKKKYKLEKHR